MAISCRLTNDCNEELNLIYKGTTPTFNFSVCLDTALLDLANTHIVFTSGSAIVDKSNTDITIADGTMVCSLTQDDTMSFNGGQVNIQILATMNSGQKPASEIISIPVSSTLRRKVW